MEIVLKDKERRFMHGKLKELERRVKALEGLLTHGTEQKRGKKRVENAHPDRSDLRGG